MNNKHLFWIIPICLLIGMIIGNVVWVFHRASNNSHISNLYDCEEGCIYAEWVVYGYRNLTKPIFYTECAEACRLGDDYFKNK